MHAPRHPERPRGVRNPGLIRPSRRLLPAAAALFAILACRPEESGSRPASAAPRRVVTLAPNLTEIVFALGAGGSLVGVSEYSDFPTQARSVPRVGGLEISSERVASLSPDLVLATREGNARGPVSALAAAGLRVVVLPTGSLDAVLESIRRAGDALGRPEEGRKLARTLAARRESVRARTAGLERPKAILLVWPDPPQAAGGGTFLDDVLDAAGAENVLRDRPGWPVLSAEYLTSAPVDVFVVPDSAVNRPAFERAFASGALSRGSARRARVIHVDESRITRPGPRVFDALEELAGKLHPRPGNEKRETGNGP